MDFGMWDRSVLTLASDEEFISVKSQKTDNVPNLQFEDKEVNCEQKPSRTKLAHSVFRKQLKPSRTFEEGPKLPVLPGGGAAADHLGINVRAGDGLKKAKVSVPASSTHDVGVLRPHWCVTKPSDIFFKGIVRHTSRKGLEEMVQDLPKLSGHVQQGCIIEESCHPNGNAYKQDEHYFAFESIGKGSYGEVERCFDLTSQKCFVKKKVLKSNFRQSEVTIPLNLEHKNVTKIFGLLCQGSGEEAFVEIMLEDAGTALNQYLVNTVLNPTCIWDLTKQGLAGLSHLHRLEMVHLDIKPENLCVKEVDNTLRLRITDFGSAKLPQEQLQFHGLTPEYMAPELCQLFLQSKYKDCGLNWNMSVDDITGKVDVLSFSLVVMYMYKRYHMLVKFITRGELSYGKLDHTTRKLMQEHLMVTLAGNASLVTDLICDECDLDMRELLRKMTHFDPCKRIAAKEAVELIEARERHIQQAMNKVQQLQRQSEIEQQSVKQAEPSGKLQIPVGPDRTYIPAFNADISDFDRGPIKYSTMKRLQEKLHKPGKRKPYPEKRPTVRSNNMLAVTELVQFSRNIASKTLNLMPKTPTAEMQDLSLREGSVMEAKQVTDTNPLVTQPVDNCGNSKVLEAVQPVDDQGFVDLASAVKTAQPDVIIVPSMPKPALNLLGKTVNDSFVSQQGTTITNPTINLQENPFTNLAPREQLAVPVECQNLNPNTLGRVANNTTNNLSCRPSDKLAPTTCTDIPAVAKAGGNDVLFLVNGKIYRGVTQPTDNTDQVVIAMLKRHSKVSEVVGVQPEEQSRETTVGNIPNFGNML